MEIFQMRVDDIVPYDKNAKKHDDRQVTQIANSLKRFGWQQPIVIDKDNVVVIGHGRLMAAKRLGMAEVPVTRADKLSKKEVKALRLADNKLNESPWDDDLLNLDLDDIGLDIDMSDFGFDLNLDDDEENEVREDGYEEPDSIESRAKEGDLWQLGEHRVICGDCTDAEVVAELMQGYQADIAFTSPPYNTGGSCVTMVKGRSKYIKNDDKKTEQEYREFLNNYLHCALKYSEYAFMNVQSLSGNKRALIDVLADNKAFYADTIIWDKQNGAPAIEKNVLNSVFEYVHVFSHKANRAIGTLEFHGTIDNVLRIPAQRNNEYSSIHNATFSVEFAGWFVSNFAKNSVLDSFGGTGTTLIACEQLKRKCFMCELEPHYVDVIIDRWEKLTGEKAKQIE